MDVDTNRSCACAELRKSSGNLSTSRMCRLRETFQTFAHTIRAAATYTEF
jgi:hypothetical protein